MSRTKHEIHGTRPPTREVLCKNCDCVLEPNFEVEYERQDYADNSGYETVAVYTGKVLGYGYRSNGLFCTKTCGYRFGVRCVKAGAAFKAPDPVRANRRKPKKATPEPASVEPED